MKYPPIVIWYLTKFPRRQYALVMAGVFIVGFVFTILGINAAIPTYTLIAMLVPISVIHAIVWYKKRRIDEGYL